MLRGIRHALACHLVRFAASTQLTGVVLLHGVWMLFAVLTWKHASGVGDGVSVLTRGLWDGYLWLGGADADGHGDLGNLLAVWAKLSLPVYLLDATARKLFGERPPMRLSRIAALSGGIALVGFGVAIWPLRNAEGAGIWMLFWLAGFAVAAALAALWAALARRVGELLVAAMETRYSSAMTSPLA